MPAWLIWTIAGAVYVVVMVWVILALCFAARSKSHVA